MRLVPSLVFATVVLASCTSSTAAAKPVVHTITAGASDPLLWPGANVLFHGDERFTAKERLAIEKGAAVWGYSTSGLIKVTIAWDMEHVPEDVINRDLAIVKLKSTDQIVIDMDDLAQARWILGLTVPSGGIWKKTASMPVIVGLVTHRVDNDAKLAQVAAHEIGHAIGLHHTDQYMGKTQSPSIMAAGFRPLDGMCLRPLDVHELCSVYNCAKSTLVYCTEGNE